MTLSTAHGQFGANIVCLLCTDIRGLRAGLPKTGDLPEENAKPKHVLFFDMGHSSTQVCVVAYNKSKMNILASAFDRNLGGRVVDQKILNYFAAQWKEKRKLNLFDRCAAARA